MTFQCVYKIQFSPDQKLLGIRRLENDPQVREGLYQNSGPWEVWESLEMNHAILPI